MVEAAFARVRRQVDVAGETQWRRVMANLQLAAHPSQKATATMPPPIGEARAP